MNIGNIRSTRTMRYGRSAAATTLLPLLAGMLLTGTALPSRAQSSAAGSVSLDLGALNGQGTYYLDFQLLDGNGSGDGNTTATISNLTLTGGSFLPPATTTGAVSGDPATAGGLQLVDSDPSGINEYVLGFLVSNPTAPLNFDLNIAGTSIDTPVADQFNFQILDNSMTPVPTNGPTTREFVTTTLDVPSPAFGAYGTAPTSPVTLAAPTVITAAPPPGGAAAPEPSSLALMGTAAAAIAGGLRKRRRLPS